MFSSKKGIQSAFLVLLLATLTGLTANAQSFTRTDLAQNAAGVSMTAPNTDASLVNSWGLSRASGSPWWVSDNGTGRSTLLDGTGATVPILGSQFVTVLGHGGPAAPTGTVFNFTTGFQVAPNTPAIFLFVSEDGTISAWHPSFGPTAQVVVDRAGKAVYKGCAIAMTANGPRLYVSNFKTGRVEVFDSSFHQLFNLGAFRSPPGDYVPFGIQNVGGNIVVTYAKKEENADSEMHAPGLGRVIIFDASGRRLLALENGPWLNAPWGIALAPSDFGQLSHRLIIGNFGDGMINAFNLWTGKHEAQMLNAATGQPMVIDGLWALSFAGDGARNGSAVELYFTSGPNGETNGLFGKLAPAAAEQRGNSE